MKKRDPDVINCTLSENIKKHLKQIKWVKEEFNKYSKKVLNICDSSLK